MSDREVKAKIGVEVDEAAFVRLKTQFNKEFEQIKSNMTKAMSGAGLDTKFAGQFAKEFQRLKDDEVRIAERSAAKQGAIYGKMFKESEKDAARSLKIRERDEEASIQYIANLRRRGQEQAAGLWGSYRGLRGMKMFDDAKDLSAKTGDSLLGTLVQLNAPFAALKVAGIALGEVFDSIRQAGKDASAALFEIGGGKNLQQTLVQAANIELNSARIAGASNMSTGAVQDMIQNTLLHHGMESDDVLSMYNAYKNSSGGNFKDMPQDTIANLAMVTGMPGEVGTFAGRMRADNKGASEGQLNDLLIKSLAVKNNVGFDIFSNPDQMEPLRKHDSVSFLKQIELIGALKHGVGMRGRNAVTKLNAYEDTDQGLNNLATSMVHNTDTNTIPGALHKEAMEEGIFADTKKGMQAFIDSLDTGNEAFKEYNKSVDEVNNTEKARLTLLNSQEQVATSNALKTATDELTAATIKAGPAITEAKIKLEEFGIKLATLTVSMTEWIAEKFNKSDTVDNLLHPSDAHIINQGIEAQQQLDQGGNLWGNWSPEKIAELKKEVQAGIDLKKSHDTTPFLSDIGKPAAKSQEDPSGESDATKIAHAKKTADNTGVTIEVLTKILNKLQNPPPAPAPTSQTQKPQ